MLRSQDLEGAAMCHKPSTSAQINQSYLGHSGRSHALKDDKDSYFVVFKNYHKATPQMKLDTIHIE